MAFMIDLLATVSLLLLIIAGIAAIVYLPYWVLMRLLKSSSAFYFRRSCRQRTFRQQTFRSKHQRHSSEPQSVPAHKPTAYEVLQCTPSDSDETIKKRYRALVKQYHPDHVSVQNNDEKVLDNAKMKMQQINDAYETVKKLRGLKR